MLSNNVLRMTNTSYHAAGYLFLVHELVSYASSKPSTGLNEDA